MKDRKDTEVQKLLSRLTLSDKAMLLSQGLIEQKDITHLGLKSFFVADGPSGVRRREEISKNGLPLICFPSVSTYACSWDRELMKEIGTYLGEEAAAEGIDVLFGPGCNLKRSPLGGRNFEYYSEDPVLTGELAAEVVNGIQETGVGACVKHFAANNQETRRMCVDEQIDERTRRELYLKAFEKPVREGKPYMVMTAYNKINGEYCANHSLILKEILRREWGYEGAVITDCVAAHDLAEGLKNGLNLKLSSETAERLSEEVSGLLLEGRITEADLDRAVAGTIALSLRCGESRRNPADHPRTVQPAAWAAGDCGAPSRACYDPEEHHRFAARAARESMVLLKNEEAVLPLKKEASLCVIGELAERLRFQGGGSAHVTPCRVDQILDAVKGYCPDVIYAKGYEGDETSERLLEEAVKAAECASNVILCVGLPESAESEGYDRSHMRLPENQERLIRAVTGANNNVIVVLSHGAPVEMPWRHEVKGILDAGLPGEAGGSAIADLLFGAVNPSGKLTETVPLRLSDTPCYLNFPGKGNQVRYAEGIYAGYRYYDKKELEVAYPFGHGLSYTEFSYRDLAITKQQAQVGISFFVKNTGTVEGKETVQIYICKPGIWNDCPVRELLNFKKIPLAPGEEREVIFWFSPWDARIYDEELRDWTVEGGRYGIEAGASSRDIRLRGEVELNAMGAQRRIGRETTIGDIIDRFGKGEQLAQLLKPYPVSSQILAFCADADPTMRAMQRANTLEVLKRSDSQITDGVIRELLNWLNASDNPKGAE